MSKWVRVMADYCSDGLWEEDGCMMVDTDLPISITLLERHRAWCEWYEKLPVHVRNADPAFCAEGLSIAQAIKAELPDWTVIYFDGSKVDPNAGVDQPRNAFEYEITTESIAH